MATTGWGGDRPGDTQCKNAAALLEDAVKSRWKKRRKTLVHVLQEAGKTGWLLGAQGQTSGEGGKTIAEKGKSEVLTQTKKRIIVGEKIDQRGFVGAGRSRN